MTQISELFEAINKGLKYYEIVMVDNALQEDGKTTGDGYACVNKVTTIVEHTSTILPGVLFQAQHFDNTLVSLTDEEPAAEGSSPMDDVVLN